MYNYVRPIIVLTSLRRLKVNNPFHANVIIGCLILQGMIMKFSWACLIM